MKQMEGNDFDWALRRFMYTQNQDVKGETNDELKTKQWNQWVFFKMEYSVYEA